MITRDFYNGIPDETFNRLYMVRDEYRINPLSFEPGGSIVVVDYTSKEVLGYDKVKDTFAYIRIILNDIFISHNKDAEFTKLNIELSDDLTAENPIEDIIHRKYINSIFVKSEIENGRYYKDCFHLIWTNTDKIKPIIASAKFYHEVILS